MLGSVWWTPPLIQNVNNPADNESDEDRLEHTLGAIETLSVADLGRAGGNAEGWEREWCEDAALDLSRGLRAIEAFPNVYLALLGRAWFLAERFREAASSYEEALNRTPGPPGARASLYRSITLSYAISDSTDDEKKWLDKELVEFPTKPEIRTRLAELESRNCNFAAAVKYLREETDLHGGDDDWKTSIILASAESSDSWEGINAALKEVSSAWRPLTEVLQFHWPTFRMMTREAQEEWVAGFIVRCFSPPDDRARPAIRRKAALSCVAAVEIELREKIFRPFKSQVVAKAPLRRDAEKIRDQVFREFLLDARHITLGEMTMVWDTSANSTDPVYKALRMFVAERSSSFYRTPHTLTQIVRFRNSAVHAAVDVNDSDAVVELCRGVINNLAPTKTTRT